MLGAVKGKSKKKKKKKKKKKSPSQGRRPLANCRPVLNPRG
jgi:hypothetical protein